jgi:hypothetical protein
MIQDPGVRARQCEELFDLARSLSTDQAALLLIVCETNPYLVTPLFLPTRYAEASIPGQFTSEMTQQSIVSNPDLQHLYGKYTTKNTNGAQHPAYRQLNANRIIALPKTCKFYHLIDRYDKYDY